MVAWLSGEGMSTAIAPIVGVDRKTVMKDVRAVQVVQSGPPAEPEPVAAPIIGLDGKRADSHLNPEACEPLPVFVTEVTNTLISSRRRIVTCDCPLAGGLSHVTFRLRLNRTKSNG